MPRILLFALLTASCALVAQAQHEAGALPAAPDGSYQVFHANGQPALLDDVVAAMAAVDVVFVGEQHDDRVGHLLQAQLLTQAYARYGAGARPRPVALSLEMFERDVQPILDEYLAGLITEQHFRKSSRPWDNYDADYQPMVAFARAHRLPVIAANAPRRYVNRVTRLGAASLDTLSTWAQAWLPPLPFPGPSPAYEARWNQMMAEMMAAHREDVPPADSVHTAPTDSMDATGSAGANPPEASPETGQASPGLHGGAHLLDAQALWDAAMADALQRHLGHTPGALVLHLVGSFHVEAGLGLPAQLEGYRPGTRRLIVVIKAVDDVFAFDPGRMGDLGDFVILTEKTPAP